MKIQLDRITYVCMQNKKKYSVKFYLLCFSSVQTRELLFLFIFLDTVSIEIVQITILSERCRIISIFEDIFLKEYHIKTLYIGVRLMVGN